MKHVLKGIDLEGKVAVLRPPPILNGLVNIRHGGRSWSEARCSVYYTPLSWAVCVAGGDDRHAKKAFETVKVLASEPLGGQERRA